MAEEGLLQQSHLLYQCRGLPSSGGLAQPCSVVEGAASGSSLKGRWFYSAYSAQAAEGISKHRLIIKACSHLPLLTSICKAALPGNLLFQAYLVYLCAQDRFPAQLTGMSDIILIPYIATSK